MNQSSIVIAIGIAGCFYVAGQYVASDPVRMADRQITVQATGTSKNVPNTGHITLGVQVEPRQTSQEATDMLARQGNAVIAAIKGLGIVDADIKTQNVSVQPSYSYENGKQTLRGYQASQQLRVTIRKTDQAGDVIAKATEAGANQIGGVSFEDEDMSVAQAAAEKDAIEKATSKAKDIAANLHVKLGKVKNYSVSQGSSGPIPYALESKMAMGGDTVTPPQVPVGTQESTATVTITYEIR